VLLSWYRQGEFNQSTVVKWMAMLDALLGRGSFVDLIKVAPRSAGQDVAHILLCVTACTPPWWRIHPVC